MHRLIQTMLLTVPVPSSLAGGFCANRVASAAVALAERVAGRRSGRRLVCGLPAGRARGALAGHTVSGLAI